jgi:hypothetical protein
MGISLLMAGYPALGVAALVVDGVALLLFSRLHRVQENPVRALERGEKQRPYLRSSLAARSCRAALSVTGAAIAACSASFEARGKPAAKVSAASAERW